MLIILLKMRSYSAAKSLLNLGKYSNSRLLNSFFDFITKGNSRHFNCFSDLITKVVNCSQFCLGVQKP